MDSTEPPKVVFEAPAPCGDARDAAARLEGDLGAARAPRPGWALHARVERDGPLRLKVLADLTDEKGTTVGHRELSEATTECAGLVKAIGVWAALVLESEDDHASASTEAVPSLGAAPPGSTPVAVGWPAPAQPEPPSPEHDWYLHHERERTLEFGGGVFLMSGTGGGALAGPVVYAVFEAGNGVFLRPSLAFGQSLTSLPPSDVKSATWGAARMDACLRVPGLYARRQGMQLDLCAGGDGGVTHVDSTTATTLPYVTLGPSIDLRGELGSHLAAVLRGVAGVDLTRASFSDLSGATEQVPLATARIELAFSWDVR